MVTAAPEDDVPGASSRRPRLAGLAVLVLIVQTLGTALATRDDPSGPGLLGYALLAVGALALASRDVAVMLVVSAGTTVAYEVLDLPAGPTFVALVVAVLVATRAQARRALWLTAAAAYAAWVLLDDPPRGHALAVAAWVVGLCLLLQLVRTVAVLAGRAVREQDRSQRERRLRQASEERLRIAAELHDVLGHHLSLINVRASVGSHLLDQRPEEARAALDTIKDASAEALREVRAVLDTLAPGDGRAPLAPAPGLAQLDTLTVDAGIPVRTTTVGEPRALPGEVDRASYRVVQEALTNVRRHAGPGATATVTVAYEDDVLRVQVDDDGGSRAATRSLLAGAGPSVEGNGITGMRERTTALGGSLVAVPLPTGGWRVLAQLPVPTRAAGEDSP